MYTFIVILITLIAIFMTIAILMQSGQGSGLSGGLAGNAAGATGMVGQRRTADFLSKATSAMGGAFLVLCLVANFFIDRSTGTQSAVQQRGLEMPASNDFQQSTESPAAIPQQPAENEN
ncbi:MAG: preprotein translocase subunit SecG [Bacteroidetes bacterium HLUCCA01]|nr:MAG: preprotein translocase subunit SecG [Bacteroidetes bacterium HLUCCA01]